jgi:hypothetical protein
MTKLTVTEYQGCTRLPGPSFYSYAGYNRRRGLHAFWDGQGNLEFFAKHKPGNGDAGWHLRRGAYVYEFCTSILE